MWVPSTKQRVWPPSIRGLTDPRLVVPSPQSMVAAYDVAGTFTGPEKRATPSVNPTVATSLIPSVPGPPMIVGDEPH